LGYLDATTSPAAALRQAKNDRREVNAQREERAEKRRHVSAASKESHKEEVQSITNTEGKVSKTDTSTKTGTNGSIKDDSEASNSMEQNTPDGAKATDENQKPKADSSHPTAEGGVKNENAPVLKKGYRRKWWGGKGRRRASANTKNGNGNAVQPTESESNAATVATEAKPEDKAASGAPETATAAPAA
jgi:hypothetical protein